MRSITSRSSMSATNLHLSRAARASERVRFPDLLDELAPLGRRDAAGLVFGDVEDLDSLARGLGLLGGAFVALAAHLVAVPAVVADKLEALIRDVLGNGSDEVAGREHLEVALNLRVHAGAVDDGTLGRRPVGRVHLHLLDREGIPDDVLREPLQILTLVGQHAAAAMDVEARMHPTSEHVRPF